MSDVDPVPNPGPPEAPLPGIKPDRLHLNEHNWRKWCVNLGGLMMLFAVALSLLIPVQKDMLYLVNRAIMALGGALLAGGILGFLEIEGEVMGNVVRGGGGFAIFLILFLVNPPAITAVEAAPLPRKAALAELETLTAAAVDRADDEEGPMPPSLEEVVKEMRFRSVQEFRVTATEEQIEEAHRRAFLSADRE